MKQKIAVLGGGVGAMTSAFYLTSLPDWRDRYDITVYQLGWRLGGKGASGRNPAEHDRIEEHGLHMFFGFYDNAFATMQALYAELGRDPAAPLARWNQAWLPHGYFVLQDEGASTPGADPWIFNFPTNSGAPGQGGVLPTPWQMFQMVVGWAKELLLSTRAEPPAQPLTEEAVGGGLMLLAAGAAPADLGELTPAGCLCLCDAYARQLPEDTRAHTAADHSILEGLLRTFIGTLRPRWMEAALGGSELRRALTLLDLGAAVAIGMLKDGLIHAHADWFKIDDVRFETWLERHGATRESSGSPPILLLSEVVFARWAGVGAGTCLQYALRMTLTYKGAFAWKMQAGMGDVIFAPFYEVLRRRGVRFEFFQSVEELGIGRDDAGRKVIDSIRIGVQATVKGGGEYRPLYDVGGLPCWPSRPLYDQLVEGEALERSGEDLENWWTRWKTPGRRVLARGRDFDVVVLGIALGAYPYICKQLIDDPEAPQFGRMVKGVAVTDTQAAQLWMTPNLAGLGWKHPPDPVIGTYCEPFDTIADMTHLLHRESWPPGTIGNVMYLTAQLPEPPATPPRDDWRYPIEQHERVQRNLESWLGKHAVGLWPSIVGTGAAGTGAAGTGAAGTGAAAGGDRTRPAWIASQFSIGVLNPSDRYVMSVPGSAAARLPSAGTGYGNLVMAGDWTLTAISAGCVEAAVMSGMHASRALCGAPAAIVGDHLPDGGDVQPIPPPEAQSFGAPGAPGDYVELDGHSTPCQPYTAQGVTMYNFVLEADYDRLAALLDRQLNHLGAPVIYRPLGPFVAFVAADMGPMAPASPRAWLDEKDFGFWIPVIAGQQEADGDFKALRTAFYVPYLWVDGHLPQQAGREVFGYPKGVGILRSPAAPQDPAEISLDALVVPRYGEPGDPDARWQWKRLVTAARRDGGVLGDLAHEVQTLFSFGKAMFEHLLKAFRDDTFPEPSLALLRSILGDLIHLDVPMVFLKQFRDAADGTKACYQAIVEASNRMAKEPFRAGLLTGDWELTIEQFASVRIIDQLGLRVTDGKIHPAFHFWVQMAFTAEPGQVIWRAV